MTLTVGSSNYTITLGSGSNNLNGLQDAINNLGAGVTASVALGGDSLYHLTVTANNAGATTLTLNDLVNVPPAQFLTSNNQGANTVFQLNGVNVSKAGTAINDVVPGVTFSILGTTSGSDSVTLTLASDRSQISNALRTVVAKYNAVESQVNAQIGPGAGLLSGNNIVWATQNAMRALANYQGTGTIKSLADLGIELSDTGQMSFNQKTFDNLGDSQIAAAFSFLGSATTGLGGQANQFTQISDPVTGLIKMQQDQFDAADKRLTDQISTLTDRITIMQTALQAKLQNADSLLASLQSQQSVLTASIQSMNYAMYGYQQNPITGN
ncbi:MAG: flagellar filament capping protein FliD [Acidobacteria bacterium]|nr:flagellar filament capping protein FliD [Acidobacteriota bacterium]